MTRKRLLLIGLAVLVVVAVVLVLSYTPNVRVP
jgi:hypothetical protein